MWSVMALLIGDRINVPISRNTIAWVLGRDQTLTSTNVFSRKVWVRNISKDMVPSHTKGLLAIRSLKFQEITAQQKSSAAGMPARTWPR